MSHIPILLNEVTRMFVTKEDGIYVDCTIGLGGHSFGILEKINKNGFLIGLDLDPYALNKAKEKLSTLNKRFSLHNTSYENFPKILEILGIKKVNGFLFDLGISSYQVDSKHRGFSYRNDALLDMRFNPNRGITARDFLNNINKEELLEYFNLYGQIKFTKQIVDKIMAKKKNNKLNTTFDLRDAIAEISNSYKIMSQVFQVIRIGVNDEINTLKNTLTQVPKYLERGGRIGALTFHSVEDRIVKHFFKDSSIVNAKDYYKKDVIIETKFNLLTKKPLLANKEEIKKNNRSRSAKFRIAEKIS